MGNVEHLVENALTAMAKKPMDAYQAFVEEMSALYNKQMLAEVSVTEEELWAIAQYVIYTWEEKPAGAEWIEDGYYDEPFVCSWCGEPCRDTIMGKPRWNYCPNCGAKMSRSTNRQK